MLAAQIQNLPPTPPTPPPTPVQRAVRKQRRGGMGALPESNLYDALDLDAIEANAQTELDSAVAEARLLIENLADEVGVEVDGLETQVAVLETSVVVSSAYVGKADGKRGAAVSPPRASTDDADDE